MKKYLPYALAALAVFALGFILGSGRSCAGLGQKYWVSRAVYDRDAAAAAEQHTADLEQVQALKAADEKKTVALAEAQKRVDTLTGHSTAVEGQIGNLEAENKKLRENAQAAIDANPALKALVANFDLQIAGYKDVVFTLKQTIAEKDKQIDLWKGKYDDMATQCKTWEAYGNREYGLRMTSDSLRIKAEHAASRSGIVAKIEGVVILGVGGYFGGKALGHALKLF